MKPKLPVYSAFLALALTGGVPAPGQNTPPEPTNYPAFSRFVAERNIFNPDREPHASSGAARHHDHPSGHRASPAFAFVGTMEYGKGTFAFFDGNKDDYRKSLQTGGSIAGYTVERITLGGVKLGTGSNTVFLAVGQQMHLNTDGTWDLADQPQDFSKSASSSAPAAGEDPSGSPAAPAVSSGGANGILERLKKLREQENK